jgi:hypothetical protein
MRLMLKFRIPVERGNEIVADGTMGKVLEELVTSVNAEAA